MPTPATTVAFDTHQDLLWAGNDYVSAILSASNERIDLERDPDYYNDSTYCFC